MRSTFLVMNQASGPRRSVSPYCNLSLIHFQRNLHVILDVSLIPIPAVFVCMCVFFFFFAFCTLIPESRSLPVCNYWCWQKMIKLLSSCTCFPTQDRRFQLPPPDVFIRVAVQGSSCSTTPTEAAPGRTPPPPPLGNPEPQGSVRLGLVRCGTPPSSLRLPLLHLTCTVTDVTVII